MTGIGPQRGACEHEHLQGERKGRHYSLEVLFFREENKLLEDLLFMPHLAVQ